MAHQFHGIKLAPNSGPHKLVVPIGEIYNMKQIALLRHRPRRRLQSPLSRQRSFLSSAICTPRQGQEQALVELLPKAGRGCLLVRGAAVDICGEYNPDDGKT